MPQFSDRHRREWSVASGVDVEEAYRLLQLEISTAQRTGDVTLSSQEYWEQRYAMGGHSGSGSTGENAVFKSEFLNDFVSDHAIHDVVE